MKKTLFVVGAGASSEFGLPLGQDLAEKIRASLDSDFGAAGSQEGAIASAIRQSTGMSRDHVDAARDLRGAILAARSIDRAIHSRRGAPLAIEIGKIAIADQILEGEQHSPLYRGIHADRDAIHTGLHAARNTWLAKLYRELAANRTPDEYNTIFESVSFVTFNYDRCIEQYLFHALQDTGGQSAASASDILGQLPIFHVYGSLGTPHYLGGKTHSSFGADGAARWCASSIRTYTEGAESGVLTQIQELVATQERVVFLGFGFDPLNVSVIYPSTVPAGQEILGTSLGCQREALLCAAFAGASASWHEFNCSTFMDNVGARLIHT